MAFCRNQYTLLARFLLPGVSLLIAILFFSSTTAAQQDSLQTIELTKRTSNDRKWLVGGFNVAAYGGSLIVLNETWYKDYPRRSFHTFNDSKEWLQVDKAGHAWTAYNTGRGSAALWRWTGMPRKKAAVIGGLSSTAYLTVIEILDARSVKWGWSWADMGANVFGSALFIGQELGWEEQRIQFKFSFHKKEYPEGQIENRVNELYGNGVFERMLKDYNAQTHWLSFNLRSFFRESKLPAWLNIAAGYGADGMLGGFENKWTDELGNDVTRYDIQRKRQFYLSPDIDLTKIKTKSKLLRSTLFFLNSFKFPAPAFMIDSKGKAKLFAVYF